MSNLTPMNSSQSNQHSLSEAKILGQRENIDFNFSQYFLKWKRHWKPAVGILVLTMLLSACVSTLLKTSYRAEGKLLFKADRTASLTGLQQDNQDSNDLKPLLINQTPVSTQIEVITSFPILQETINRAKLTDSEGQLLAPKALKDSLKIKMIGGSDVVEISYHNRDAKAASDVVNTLMEVYIDNQIGNKQSESKVAREFIAKELPLVEDKVLQAETALRDFKSKNSVLALNKEAETAVTQLADLNQKITTTEAQLRGIEAQADALKAQLGLSLNQALAVNKISDSPTIGGLLEQIKAVEEDINSEKQIYRENHPNVVNLQEKRLTLNKKLQQEIRDIAGNVPINQGLLKVRENKENQLEKFITLGIQKTDLSRQLNSLYQSKKVYQERANQIPGLEKRQADLDRQINSAKNTYETLLNSLQQVQVTENRRTGNAQIIEPAKIPDRGSSKRLLVLAGGTMFGLLLAQIAVILLDRIDKSLKTIPEIKEIFPYNVLGIIPFDEVAQEVDIPMISIVEKPESFVSEIYRMIQVNLKLLNLDKQQKVILVSSSVPEEGKSTVSANLAAAVAQSKRRVLLIDGDLRNPSQQILWQVSNQVGLSDILSDRANLADAVSRPIENLSLLTTGQTKSNPLTLLDSQEMADLIEEAKRNYDVVIIDAPPLLVTADVLTMGKMTEGILLVSRIGVVEKESAQAARASLENSGQKVLGLVVNGVDQQEFDSYFYYTKKYFAPSPYSDADRNGSKSPAKI
jgi:capsular exopolysaccharide synthesis family protein